MNKTLVNIARRAVHMAQHSGLSSTETVEVMIGCCTGYAYAYTNRDEVVYSREWQAALEAFVIYVLKTPVGSTTFE